MAEPLITARVQGLPDLRKALESIAPKLRKRALRNALAFAARPLRDAARRAAPRLAAPIRNKAGQVIRQPGTVANAISIRNSGRDKRSGNVGVFLNVRPAQGAKYRTSTRSVLGLKVRQRVQVRASQRGRNSPTDPFYWRWLEFGTRKLAPRPFLARTAGLLDQALARFSARIGPAIAKINGGIRVEID